MTSLASQALHFQLRGLPRRRPLLEVAKRTYHAQNVVSRKPTWQLDDISSWKLLGSFADTSDPQGGSVRLYTETSRVRLVHDFYGPLDLEGRLKTSQGAGATKISFGDIEGRLSRHGIDWNNGYSTPRCPPKRSTPHRSANVDEMPSPRAKVNAALVLGKWRFSESVVEAARKSVELMKRGKDGAGHEGLVASCAGSIPQNVPLDWEQVERGRDLFISGLGKFDIGLAARYCAADTVPSVAQLRGHGYLQRFLQANSERQSKEPRALDEEVLQQLRTIFETPESVIAKYIWKYRALFGRRQEHWLRLDELEEFLGSLPEEERASAINCDPSTLLNRSRRQIQEMDWGPDEAFEYLEGVEALPMTSQSGGDYLFRVLKSAHQVIYAGQALGNCARIHIPKVKSKHSILVTLCRKDEPVAMGQWHVIQEEWLQKSEKANKRLRKEWARMFEDVEDLLPRVNLGLYMQRSGVRAFNDVFSIPASEELVRVSCELGNIGRWSKRANLSKGTVHSMIRWPPLSPEAASAVLPVAVVDGCAGLVERLLKEGARVEASASIALDSEGKGTGKGWSGTCLLIAAKLQHWSIARALLEHGANVRATSSTGETLVSLAVVAQQWDFIKSVAGHTAEPVLVTAVSQGDVAVVRRLIDDPDVDVNATDSDGRTALMVAAMRGHEEVARCLLEAGADKEAKDKWGQTALVWAWKDKELCVANLLLQDGAYVKASDTRACAALLRAADIGDVHLVESLLVLDVDVNHSDSRKRTALMMAAGRGHRAVVEALLQADADPDLRDVSGRTAFLAAFLERHYKLAADLAWHCQPDQVLATSKQRNTLAYEVRKALRQEDHDMIAAFAHAGLSFGPGHDEISEAFRQACRVSDVKLVKALTKLGVDINGADKYGHTPLISAAHTGCLDVVQHLLVLLASGSALDIDAQDQDGRTALMLAMEQSHRSIVVQLLRAGASLESCDSRGRTALQRLRKPHRELMERVVKDMGMKVPSST